MSSGLMDTEPGGEGSQYESIKTVTKPHSKEGGKLGKPQTEVDETASEKHQDPAGKDGQIAENGRHGQAISERGLGGETTESGGSANHDGYGSTELRQRDGDMKQTRREQGYGGGSGVGG